MTVTQFHSQEISINNSIQMGITIKAIQTLVDGVTELISMQDI